MGYSSAETAMERLDLLGSISDEPDRLTRQFAGEAIRRANEKVEGWMREAGMAVRRDNIGNLRGRYAGVTPDAPALLLGSHLDSVRDAGKYDGPLGVVVAIAAVQRLHDANQRLPFAIEVLAFADEEGLRFGSTYLGSRAIAGTFDRADLDRTDDSGGTMANAIRAFGGDPARVDDDRWHGAKLLGYCEVHIEQGPVLEARDLPVGVVSAISGQQRFSLVFKGEAGHAGTVPMDRRHDALVAASMFVVAVESYAASLDGLVATVGQLSVRQGAANVVPGEVILSLDVRHTNDEVRISASQHLCHVASQIANDRNISLTLQQVSDNAAVACSPRLVTLLSQAVGDVGHPVLQLASGAGHDAVTMSALTEVAMLFVRCKGGISHNPAESVTADDVAVSIDVLSRFLELLADA
jgi:allantoate deiminase